jgi:hypothetical protein
MGVFISTIALLSYHEVDNSLTSEDKQYIVKFLDGIPALPEKRTYQNEVDTIILIQNSVLTKISHKIALPFGTTREPKDVFIAKAGGCYDRSRVIEKILRYLGFKTRHIAMYSTIKTGSAIKSLTTKRNPSHAITEVLTKKGWLVVDSNSRWISTDSKNYPVSLSKIQLYAEGSASISWNQKPPYKIYENPFTFVYGLYSRHGRFYPPYNFIPDINYKELTYNIF